MYTAADLPRKNTQAVQLPFFRHPAGSRARRLQALPAVPSQLAPGSAPVDDGERIAQLIVQRLEEGTLDDKAGLEDIADQFELSSRQVRRIVQKELGVPPIQLLLTRRLLLAKQLLTETTLPITEVAFASGFSSLRRFNDAFNSRYRMAPTRLRKRRRRASPRSRKARRRRCNSRIDRRTAGRRPPFSGGPRTQGSGARNRTGRMREPSSLERRAVGYV